MIKTQKNLLSEKGTCQGTGTCQGMLISMRRAAMGVVAAAALMQLRPELRLAATLGGAHERRQKKSQKQTHFQ